jgi:hypothetical protein
MRDSQNKRLNGNIYRHCTDRVKTVVDSMELQTCKTNSERKSSRCCKEDFEAGETINCVTENQEIVI